MPTSTITSKGQTTVPKQVREALNVAAGDRLTWEVSGGRVVVKTDRPRLWSLGGSVTGGPDDPVHAVAEARKTRGRI